MLKKICGFISTILIIILALAAGVLLLPRVLGYETMAVLSGSMEPEYPVGSMIGVKKDVDPTTLEAGDIITYYIGEDTVVTHRIVEVQLEEQQFITKGDSNETEDANPVLFSNLIGEAQYCIPYLGFVSIYATTPLGIGVICGLLVLIILVTFLPDIFEKEEEEAQEQKKKGKKKKNKLESEPQAEPVEEVQSESQEEKE